MLCAFWNKPEFPNTKEEKRNSHVHLDNQNLRNMWAVWILLCAVCFTGSFAVNPVTINLLHGKPLNIRLSGKSDIVEFTAHDKKETIILYPKSSPRLRGNVKEVKKVWDFVIDSVIFEDRGIYRVKNSRNILSNVYKVNVSPKIGTYKHVAGETLSIGLDGLKPGDVSMTHSRADFNLTLVTRGSPVGNAHPDYKGRIQVTNDSIKILKVDVSDQGNYTLTDGLNRKFFTVRLILTGSNAVKNVTINLMHGKPLNIRLSGKSDIVEFTAHNKTETVILYPKSSPHLRGNVKEVKKVWDFVIDSVIFEDRGIYSVKNSRNILSNVYKVKVSPKIETYKHVAGETLSIGLDGLKLDDVTMMFSREDFNLTLVTRGSPAGNTHPDYQGRIQVTSDSIKILKVNVSDQGNYTLTDGLNRKFFTARLILIEKQKLSALGALLLLLGIPAGVCCYCYCCKDKSKDSNKADTNTSPEDGVKLESTNSPAEPQPASNNPVAPAAPTMMYPGYPPADGGTVYPPPQAPYSVNPAMPSNPAFSPMYPPMAGYPPAHPSQWAGAPYNQPTTEISSASPLLPPTQP